MECKSDNGNSGNLNTTIVLRKMDWPEIDENLLEDDNEGGTCYRNGDAAGNVNLNENSDTAALNRTFDKDLEKEVASVQDQDLELKMSKSKPSIPPKPTIQRGILSKIKLSSSASNMKPNREGKAVGVTKVVANKESSSTPPSISNVKSTSRESSKLTRSLKMSLSSSSSRENAVKMNNNVAIPNRNTKLLPDIQKLDPIKPSFRQIRNLSQTSPNLQNVLKHSLSANKPKQLSNVGSFGRRKSTDGILDCDSLVKTSRGKPRDFTSTSSSKRSEKGLNNGDVNLTRPKSLSSKKDIAGVKRNASVIGDKSSTTSRISSAPKSRPSLSSESNKEGTTVPSKNLVKSKSSLSDNKGFNNFPKASKTKTDIKTLPAVRRSSSSVASKHREKDLLKSLSKSNLCGQSVQSSVHHNFKNCEEEKKSKRQYFPEFEKRRKIHEYTLKSFDVLAICYTRLREDNDQLNALLEVKDKNISILERNIEDLQKEKTVAEKDFNKLLHQLGSDIETMCIKHEEEKKALSEVQESKMETLMFENHKKVESLKQKHCKELEELHDNHAKELKEVNSSNENLIEQLKQNHAESKSRLKGEFDAEKCTLVNKIETLETKLGTWIKSQSSGPDQKSCLIQELENDVRSLRSVLELRNEEIKNLKRDNDEMVNSVASLNKSQTKIKNLSCQVEDLKELLEVKRRNERRLDSEMLKLEESIRNQSREKNQLYRDKEQLQWKVKHKLSSSFVRDHQSHSFSGSTEHSEGNFKTFTVVHSSMNVTAPVEDHPLVTDTSYLNSPMAPSLRPPSYSSTPSTSSATPK